MQRLNFASVIRLSRVLLLSLLVAGVGGLPGPEAAVQTVLFCPKTDFGTCSFPVSVAVSDFNGDGKLDLAVANNGSNKVSILLGTGTGSFGAKTDFITGTNPVSIAVGDFNADGKLDLAVANQSNDNKVSILLGSGTGTFGDKTDFGTGSIPFSVAVGDFNRDGKLDLAVADEGANKVSILLNTTTGQTVSFGANTDFVTGSSPSSVAVGDFDRDGKLDLAVANRLSNTVSILLGTGTGTFGAKSDFGTSIGPASVAARDFNGDDKFDLAVVNFDSNTVSILLNTTTGQTVSFGANTDFATGANPRSVAVSDLNGDGKLDLAVANIGSTTVSILLGSGTGSFGTKTDFGAGAGPAAVAAGDLNGDGKLDLAAPNSSSDDVSILLSTCSSQPSITAAPVTRSAGNPSMNSQIATVDDAEDARNTLTVRVNAGLSATVNGVTVALNPTGPNTSGQVFADVVAVCSATTASFTLRVTDSGGLFSEATLTVTVLPPPTPAIFPTTQAFTSSGGSNTVNVTSPSCPWNAVSNDAFIVINSGTPGSGDGTVAYTVANNTGPVRMGTMTIAGITFTVTQDSNCTFSLSRDHESFAGNGGSGVVSVTTSDPGCTWTASTTSIFVTITMGSSGTGNGNVQYTVAPNAGTTIRHDTIAIAGQTFTVYEGINFSDVPVSPCYDDIGKLSARGVTVGYPDGRYRPNDPVTREQMAAFIMRAKGEFTPTPPADPNPRFGDVPGGPNCVTPGCIPNVFYDFIDRIAALNITLGCAGGSPPLYCPSGPVTREQMAAFIMRALGEFNPPLPPVQRFNDVPPANAFYGFIDRLGELNITLGCTPDHLSYCPSDPVTRCQMASFLVRAFNL